MNCNIYSESVGFTTLDALNMTAINHDIVLRHRPMDHIVFEDKHGVEHTIVRLSNRDDTGEEQ